MRLIFWYAKQSFYCTVKPLARLAFISKAPYEKKNFGRTLLACQQHIQMETTDFLQSYVGILPSKYLLHESKNLLTV